MNATDILEVQKKYGEGAISLAEASLALILIGLSAEEVDLLLSKEEGKPT